MIGYYSYINKIRPYFRFKERADYTVLLLTFLAVLLFFFLALQPLFAATLRTRREVQVGEAYENALTQKILNLSQAEKNYEEVASQGLLKKIAEAVPEGPAQPELLQELSLDAGRAGVNLSAVRFGERTENRLGEEIFDFAADGAETRLLPFLQELEEGRTLILVSLQAVVRRQEGVEFMQITLKGKSLFIP